MHIARIYQNNVNTKNGLKLKYTIEDEKGNKLDVWQESWDSTWQEGMDIELEKSLIKSRSYNGKTYYTYQKPYTVQNTAPKPQNEPVSDLKDIKAELSRINTVLAYIVGKLEAKERVESPAPLHDADYQETQNEINKLFP